MNYGDKVTIEGTIIGYTAHTKGCCDIYPNLSYIVQLTNGDTIEINEGDMFMYKVNAESAKDKHWSGKVICTDSISFFWTQGKIYEVENGALHTDTKHISWCALFDKCPDEITYNGMPVAKFIEFKGFANE